MVWTSPPSLFASHPLPAPSSSPPCCAIRSPSSDRVVAYLIRPPEARSPQIRQPSAWILQLRPCSSLPVIRHLDLPTGFPHLPHAPDHLVLVIHDAPVAPLPRRSAFRPGCAQMPRARRPRREWSDGLPPELLGVIFLDLTCLADRVYFSAVCRAWRSAARAADGPPAPRQLPWLLLPSLNNPSFFSLHPGAKRRLSLPESVRGARLCGSHDGGWVALAFEQWRGYAAVNLLSGARVLLPDRLRTALPHSHAPHANTACEHHMLIRTVTFSRAPSADGCLAAAHVSSASNIAFWRSGMNGHWITCGIAVDVIQDIIYYENELKQGFHVLTNTEDITVYTPNGGEGGAPLVMSRTSYQVQKRADYRPDSFLPKSLKVSRYLVESRGKLLMILRLYRCRTFRFRIFEMNLAIGPAEDSEASWVELHSLPGRVLLLGRGCSRALELSQFNRVQLGSIYYLDDTSFNVSLGLSSGSKYSSTDMGVYGGKALNRTHCGRRFPRKFTSDGSPPIWFMP